MGINYFIKKVVLVIFLPILTVSIFYNYLYNRIPNSYSLKENYLAGYSDRIEVLILGASQTFLGLNPDSLIFPAFNAANVSQDLRRDCRILEKHIDNLDNLKYIVLGISYPTFFSSLESRKLYYRIRKYALFMGIKEYPFYELRYNYEYSREGLFACLDYYVRNKDLCQCTSKGWGTSYMYAPSQTDWERQGKMYAYDHTFYGCEDTVALEKVIKENLAYLDRIMVICRRHGVQPVFLTIPVHPAYYKWQNQDQLKRMYALIDHYCEQNGVKYLDLSQNTAFCDEDFFDVEHLSLSGANKVSSMIDRYLYQINKETRSLHNNK